MAFSVLTRYLKGMQWMTDTYDAKGNEYQPEVVPVTSDGSNVKQQINNIENNITNINNTLGDLITYGTSDLTPGSSSLATGHVYLVYE